MVSNDAHVIALQENLSHARHQETQRERYLALYWLIWAATLTFIGGKGDLLGKVEENLWIFGFLTIMSFATLTERVNENETPRSIN